MRHLPRFGGDSTALYGPTDDNQPVALNFNDESLSLVGTTNDVVLVRGNHDMVGYAGGSGMLTDMGNATSLAISGNTQLEVSHWSPSDVVSLPYETTIAVTSDNQGGTFLTTGSGAIIHFADAAVPVSQIVSSAPVTVIAPVAPDPPPPAPSPDPPPPAPSTVHNVATYTAFYSGFDGTTPNASDGDTFNLAADNIPMSLYGFSDTMTFVQRANDIMTMQYPTGNNSITDNGQGTMISVNELSSTQNMTSIFGFQNDPAATLKISDGLWWKGLAPTTTPDGHGGSFVVNTGGQAFVDLVGDPNPSTTQFSEFRAV